MTAYLIIALLSAAIPQGASPQGTDKTATKTVTAKTLKTSFAQRIYSKPQNFSRWTLVPAGTVLTTTGNARGPWHPVSYTAKSRFGQSSKKTGWTPIPAKRRSAGELADVLGVEMTESVLLTLKGFGEFVRGFKKNQPRKERAFDALRQPTLTSVSVEDFAKSGGLRLERR